MIVTDPRPGLSKSFSKIDTGSRPGLAANTAIRTQTRSGLAKSIQLLNTGPRDGRALHYKAPEPGQTLSPFETAIRRFNGKEDFSMTFEVSTGNGSELCIDAESVVISQTESTTQSMTINANDPCFEWDPYGSGPYKDTLVKDATVRLNVNYAGQPKSFFATMKSPSIERQGGQVTDISWPGHGHSIALYKKEKTYPTVNADPTAPVLTNKNVISEMCSDNGLDCSYRGVTTIRLGGPFHRQNRRPGDLIQTVLDLTVDEWRDEVNGVVFYDPYNSGTTWQYSADNDLIFSLPTNPVDNDEIEAVKVLRAIATGQLQPNNEETSYLKVEAFQQYEVTFDPPLSGIQMKIEYQSRLGSFSDFIFYRGEQILTTRGVRNNSTNVVLAAPDSAIFDCDRCVLTWGASEPEVSNQGITGAPGALEFYGRPTPRGSVGSGENVREPLDKTTSVTIPPGAEDPLEIGPSPLFYGEKEMRLHGERYLERAGKRQVRHGVEIPLNHLIVVGDKLLVDLGRDRGHRKLELLVIETRHTISAFPQLRKTNLQCLELSIS